MADDDQTQAAFDNFVQLWTTATTGGRRAPVLRRPDEVGLDYEDVTFPSMDGVPLEGWSIPADSDRLVIHNHFLPGNRYGYPGHLPEFGGLGGFEVSFLPEYRALHDAGYNILAYDLRNHGLSGQGNGGIAGIGLLEYRDVIGSLRYAAARPDTQDMNKVLLSVCLGQTRRPWRGTSTPRSSRRSKRWSCCSRYPGGPSSRSSSRGSAWRTASRSSTRPSTSGPGSTSTAVPDRARQGRDGPHARCPGPSRHDDPPRGCPVDLRRPSDAG
jgi:hypothetical protein